MGDTDPTAPVRHPSPAAAARAAGRPGRRLAPHGPAHVCGGDAGAGVPGDGRSARRNADGRRVGRGRSRAIRGRPVRRTVAGRSRPVADRPAPLDRRLRAGRRRGPVASPASWPRRDRGTDRAAAERRRRRRKRHRGGSAAAGRPSRPLATGRTAIRRRHGRVPARVWRPAVRVRPLYAGRPTTFRPSRRWSIPCSSGVTRPWTSWPRTRGCCGWPRY